MYTERKGNIFDSLDDNPQAIVITTNGFVKRDGQCVMGAGIAKEFSNRVPNAAATLGSMLKSDGGNRVYNFETYQGIEVLSFPVKPISKAYTGPQDVVEHQRNNFNQGDTIPGWACVADIALIEESLKQLVEIVTKNNWTKVYLPRVGCGFGELDWESVKPLLDQYLDDRFVVFQFDTPYNRDGASAGNNNRPKYNGGGNNNNGKPRWGQTQASGGTPYTAPSKPTYQPPANPEPATFDSEIPF